MVASYGALAGLALAGLSSVRAAPVANTTCPDYNSYSQSKHTPYSSGVYQLSYMRPDPQCRTFVSPAVDQKISQMQSKIKDPDLYRLFQNSYPNTLDTAIKWKGVAANNSAEELTFVITGDINAMWLRDSANQMQSYLPLLKANSSMNSLASLYRGVINLQSRYILTSPYCNSFQPPVESNIPPSVNGAATSGNGDQVNPPYSNNTVFECKYELDSLAAFLEVSSDYYSATNDAAFFGKFQWIEAVQTVLAVANDMMSTTYASSGAVNTSPYSFQRTTTSGTETLDNSGAGNPEAAGTGLVRSAFRPSDDATIYQLFIPANMMFSHFLAQTAPIMSQLGQASLASEMSNLSGSLKAAIQKWGIVDGPAGQQYAYEVDGYGSRNLMDDANIPSLLSAPFFGYLSATDPVYETTRKQILSTANPYWSHGPVFSAVAGPHAGPGQAWPMASIVRIFTSDNDSEIQDEIRQLISSTDGLGLIHESINSFNQSDWTRQWFSWANGLFGQMVLDLEGRKPALLQESYQP